MYIIKYYLAARALTSCNFSKVTFNERSVGLLMKSSRAVKTGFRIAKLKNNDGDDERMMIWIGDGPEPSSGSRNRNNTEACPHSPGHVLIWQQENKTRGHATVSSVTDCLNIRPGPADSNDHNGHREEAPISH